MWSGVIDDEPGRLIFVGMRNRTNVRPKTRITLSSGPNTFVDLIKYHCIWIQCLDDLGGIQRGWKSRAMCERIDVEPPSSTYRPSPFDTEFPKNIDKSHGQWHPENATWFVDVKAKRETTKMSLTRIVWKIFNGSTTMPFSSTSRR